MTAELTPRQRERLDRWSLEGGDSEELQQRRQARQQRAPDIEAVVAGRGGDVEIERLAATSSWVEPAEVRLAIDELSTEAIERRLMDAVAAEDDLDDVFDVMSTEPFPTPEFLGELYGWTRPETHPIHTPFSADGLAYFGFEAPRGYEGTVHAFQTLALQVGTPERADPELPLAYEIDALFEQITEQDLRGFVPEDLSVLGFAEGDPRTLDESARRDLDWLWGKAVRLVGELGDLVFGAGKHQATVWPWEVDGDAFPFIWGRLKTENATEMATHIGFFFSREHCNLCIDLEKDLIDAGEARESVSEVHAFYRQRLADALPGRTPDNLKVWTDADNVLPIREFLETDFDTFMEANRDEDHPWPRVGYLLEAREVLGWDGAWTEELGARLEPLVPVYRTMVAAHGR